MPTSEGSTRSIFTTRDRFEVPMGMLIVGHTDLELDVIEPEHP
jgi:hypothetical protein